MALQYIIQFLKLPWQSGARNIYPHKKISEILLLHSDIIVVLSNK